MSFDECLVYLKTFGRHLDADIDKFFLVAMSFKISKQMLKDLEKLYASESVPSDVIFDHDQKKWLPSIPLPPSSDNHSKLIDDKLPADELPEEK